MEQAATLIRVSSDAQDESNQLSDVDRHIKANGYTVARKFELHDVSASKGEQEATLKEIMADIQDGKYTVVVVAHSSRIDRRDPRIQRLYTDSVSLAGGRIESAREPEFGKNTLGGDIMTVVAQWSNFKYSKDLGEHVDAAFKRIDDNNAIRGKALYGYRITGAKYSKQFEIVESEAEVIRDACHWYLAGETLAQIVRKLNRDGRLPRPVKYKGVRKVHQWSEKTLSQLLRSETICGRRHQGDAVVRVPSIITVAEWDAVQARLDAKAYRKGVRTHEDTAMLTSLAYCGQCLLPLYRTMCGYGASRKPHYYARPDKGHTCGCMVPLDALDELVNTRLIDPSADIRIPHEVTVPGHNYQDDIDHLAKRQSDLFRSKPAGWLAEVSELEAEIERLRGLPSEPDTTETRMIPVSKLAAVWAEYTPEVKREQLISAGIRFYAFKIKPGTYHVEIGDVNGPVAALGNIGMPELIKRP